MPAPTDGSTLTGSASPRDTRGTIPLLLVAAFVVILNETILAMALPHLMTDLQIDAVTAQWLSTAFMLTMAVVIPITGFILQRFDTRPVFLAAMGLFSAGTLLAAFSVGFPMLLGARIIQACGTAIMMPLLMTTILNLVPMAQRGRMMGNITIVISLAPAMGPTVSGLILQWLGWRWIFLLVLPIAVGTMVLGYFRLKNVSDPQVMRIDVPSVVLSAFGFGGLVYSLSKIGERSDGGTLLLAVSLTVGVVSLLAFVLRQVTLQRSGFPLLDLRTFTRPTFTLSLGAMMVSFAALIGSAILLPIYLQNVRGLPTVTAGLILLPGGLLMGLMGPVVGRLYDRFGPRVLTIPGSLLVVGALFGFSRITQSTPIPGLLALHITMMVGLALTFTPLFTSGLNVLPKRLYSHGSALVGTLQQVAGAAGTALLVTVMALGQARALSEGAGPVLAQQSGIQGAMGIAAYIAIAGVVLVCFIGKPTDLPTDDDGPAYAPATEHAPTVEIARAVNTDDPEVVGQLR